MDANRKLIARKMFRLRVYEAKGTEYQRLFEKVMQYRYEGFVPIKPYGNIGDRKNDGYIPATGAYFQVYAPENPSSPAAIKTAADKAIEDFGGLVEHWHEASPIRAFRFVFNDSYRGSPPPIEAAMAAIKRNHHVEAGVFLAKDLENKALSLTDDQLIDIINTPIPDPGPLASVDFSILREVVSHVMETKSLITPTTLLNAPSFDDKIQFNGLTKGVANLLTVGSYQSEAVTDFFSKNSTFARQQLRDQLASIYAESSARLGEMVAERAELGDLVFFDLLAKATPNRSKTTLTQSAAAQESAIVVMAFYFEACDIFEDPDATT